MTADRLAELERAVGAPVSRETFERMRRFETEFGRWATRINLVSSSTLPSLWRRHILDSAQLLRLAPDAARWIDLGSGGGFPGAVIALLLMDRPGTNVTLVESNGKKAAFLRTVLGSLNVPARVLNTRIESCAVRNDICDVVTARALAPLSLLLGLAAPWLERGARGLFHKGREYRQEIEESRDGWLFDLVEHASIADPESVVLDVRNLRRQPRT